MAFSAEDPDCEVGNAWMDMDGHGWISSLFPSMERPQKSQAWVRNALAEKVLKNWDAVCFSIQKNELLDAFRSLYAWKLLWHLPSWYIFPHTEQPKPGFMYHPISQSQSQTARHWMVFDSFSMQIVESAPSELPCFSGVS